MSEPEFLSICSTLKVSDTRYSALVVFAENMFVTCCPVKYKVQHYLSPSNQT